jgi:hypothetical protein
MHRIRRPCRDELEPLRSIERDAGRAFAAIGMAEIAADEPPSLVELESHRAKGRAWVAVDTLDRPIAYLLSSVVDGCAHIDQVSVASANARRGLGVALSSTLPRSRGRKAALR